MLTFLFVGFCVDCIKFSKKVKKEKLLAKKFIWFLLASSLIWLLITLSKEYITTIKLPVSYHKLPQNILLQNAPINEIIIQIEATGFKILRTKFTKKPILLNCSNLSKKKEQEYYILPNKQKMYIQQQLLHKVVLLEVLKDSIFLDLGVLSTKKIPVIPNLNLNYHIGYDILDSVKIEPDSIVITGEASRIKKISSIDLVALQLKDIKSNFKKKVPIKKPINFKDIKLSANAVVVSATVEKFTEKIITIPYKVVNLPENMRLNTLAKTVELVVKVGLSNYHKINQNSFSVICDFSVSENNNLSFLLPKVTVNSNLIKSYRVIPNKIDFLIQK